MAMVIRRFDVFLIDLDPTIGTEIKKTRPCAVISPDEMNRHLRTIIVAPMTSRRRTYPSRVACRFQGKSGEIVLDQIRTVDRQRLVKKLGKLSQRTSTEVLDVLQEMFAP
jgi:mRNA interferase MazF